LHRLEGYLAREQARSAEAQAEAERIGEVLADERRTVDALRQELRQHPEQLARLSPELADAQADAATARGQRDALQDRVRDLERQVQQLGARRPEERGAAATRSDLDALGNQLRGEIRDLTRAPKDVQSPLPRILAMTREVREGVAGIQKSEGLTAEALERLERASESLAITTDYLVAIGEEDEEAEDDEGFADEGEEDLADSALEVVDDHDGDDEDAPGQPRPRRILSPTIGAPSSNASRKPGSPGASAATRTRRSISCICSRIYGCRMPQRQTSSRPSIVFGSAPGANDSATAPCTALSTWCACVSRHSTMRWSSSAIGSWPGFHRVRVSRTAPASVRF
jgi:predicted  nucleic acid-binding Zn-ribbon protein